MVIGRFFEHLDPENHGWPLQHVGSREQAQSADGDLARAGNSALSSTLSHLVPSS